MKTITRYPSRLGLILPIFCSITVLSAQLQASPTIQLNGDASKDNMADSGRLGYVGANTRIGVSIDRHLQGQVDVNQIIHEDNESATSAEGWFGYKIKDDDQDSSGIQGGGVKLNHQWVNDEVDTVHKVFGAYDQNADDQSKITVGYGQEGEDLFWSGHLSKGMGDEIVTGDTTRRAYDYGVGGEIGTFIDSSLTRVRGGLEYEFGTHYANTESRPSRTTVSAGVEQFFEDTSHSVSLDVSGHQKTGGNDTKDTDFNARLGYHYEFGGEGAFQSASTTTQRRRVEIPGTPARPARPAQAAIPAQAAVAARAAIPAQPAIPAKYERRAIKTPGHQFVKTTMKLENETFFDRDSSTLTDSATRNLDNITAQIRSHGYLGTIRITGNTCGMGDPVYDQRLSEKRAQSVRDYLIMQGFNPDHLIARGLGKGSPKYDRKDSDFKNRRVDLEYVTERSIKKAGGKIHYKNVLVQEGRPAIPAQAARPGRAGHPGRPAIPAVAATPATPSRFIWQTERIQSAPIWVKRALHNTIRHNRSISTYTTQTAAMAVDDKVTLTSRSDLIDVLKNDSPGTTLTRVSIPPNGTATIENGKIRYEPNPGYNGPDSFTYTTTDRNGNETTATVTISVPTAVNGAPTLTPDTITTSVNTAVMITVLGNDTDPENDTLTLESTTTPEHGTVKVINNEIEYTPNTDYTGVDTFSYTVSDGNLNLSSTTVTVTISDTNTAPSAQDDTISTTADNAVTINVTANDTDPENDSLSVIRIGTPANGSATITGNNIVYTPKAGFTGTDTFSYTITDSKGHESTANITVTINSNNQAPKLVNDTQTTIINTATTIDVTSNDSDADGDTLQVVSTTNPTHGSVSIVSNQVVYTPQTNYVGNDRFTYTVTDGNGHGVTALVDITVKATNLPPIAVDDRATTDYQTAVIIPVADNDSDPDGSTTCVTNIASNPSHGSVVILTSGTEITYTPFNGYSGTDSFVYTACDSDGATSTATVTVTVNENPNRPPVLSPNYAAIQGYSSVPIRVLEDDMDPEGDTLSIVRTESGPSNGSTRIESNIIYYTATPGFTGSDVFYYVASDGQGNERSARVDVEVKNDGAPVIATIPAFNVAVGTQTALDIGSYISDPDGDAVYIAVADALSGSLTFSGTTLHYTPVDISSGDTDTIYITVSDGTGGTTNGRITVNIQ